MGGQRDDLTIGLESFRIILLFGRPHICIGGLHAWCNVRIPFNVVPRFIHLW